MSAKITRVTVIPGPCLHCQHERHDGLCGHQIPPPYWAPHEAVTECECPNYTPTVVAVRQTTGEQT